MAKLFYTKQEFETLEEEKQKLADKISVFELRLKHRDEANTELKRQIETLNDDLTSRDERISEYEEIKVFYENENFRLAIENTTLRAEIAQLKEQIASIPIRPHNERNAGRKQKATPEQISLILSLKSQGESYYEIARIFTKEYGEKWNKSTIRNTALLANK